MNVERAATIRSQAAFLLRSIVAIHLDRFMKQRPGAGACSVSLNADLRGASDQWEDARANVGRPNMASLVAPPVTIGTASRTRRPPAAASHASLAIRCDRYRGDALCPLPRVGATRRSGGAHPAHATGSAGRNGWCRRARHVCLAKEAPGTRSPAFTDSERAPGVRRRFAREPRRAICERAGVWR